MFILLSPAKKQSFESPERVDLPLSKPIFQKNIQKLVAQMQQFDPVDIENLMKVSHRLAQQVYQMYLEFQVNEYSQPISQPALFALKGDVYRALDAGSLSSQALSFANDHLRILSGLYGLLKPADLIQPYRLEMGTKLMVDGQKLVDYWRGILTKHLQQACMDQMNPGIINLASNEYASAIDRKKLDCPWYDIQFKTYRQGQYRTIGILAKRARGLMARYIANHQIDTIDQIKHFNESGYEYRPDLSTTTQLCFVQYEN